MAASGGRRCLWFMMLVVIFLCVSGISMAARPTRQLQNSFQKGNKVLRTELIHRDHPDSPLSTNASHSERLAACMERSERRRARFLISSTDFQSPLTGSSQLGEYVMKISLGTPAQERSAIVDTGSDLVWLQCQCGSNCQKQTDPLFDPTASTSNAAVSCTDPLCSSANLNIPSCDSSCGYLYTYGDESTTEGHFLTDTITLSDSTGTATAIQGFYFGCGQNQTGNFNGADGLIGFGQGAISLPSQMASLYSEVFSYCLVPQSSATTSTSTLLFGSTASSATGLTQTSILSIPAFPTFYYVPMVGITVEGVDLGLPQSNFAFDTTTSSGGVIFDSGTTFTNFDNTSITAIVQKYRSLVTYPEIDLSTQGFVLCYDVSQVASPTFPSMAFQFTDAAGTATVDFPLAGENVFTAADSQGNQQCLAFSVGSSPSIIGNIAMADHLMEYDVVQKVIGWQQKVC